MFWLSCGDSTIKHINKNCYYFLNYYEKSSGNIVTEASRRASDLVQLV